MSPQIDPETSNLFVQGTLANLKRFGGNAFEQASSKMGEIKQKLQDFRDESLKHLETELEKGREKYEVALAHVQDRAREITEYCKMEAQFGCDVARKEVARQIGKVASSTFVAGQEINTSTLQSDDKTLISLKHQEARADLDEQFNAEAKSLLVQNLEGGISRKEFTAKFTALQDSSTHQHFKKLKTYSSQKGFFSLMCKGFFLLVFL
jgi:hypothetical protein